MTPLSRAEAEALILKAAAGSGMPWGLAEEAAMAAGWLAVRGLGWAGPFAALLGQNAAPSAPTVGDVSRAWRAAGAACPIALGAALCDFAELPEGDLRMGPLDLEAVMQPVLLLPFAWLLSKGYGRSVALKIPDGRVCVTPEGRVMGDFAALLGPQQMQLSLSLTEEQVLPTDWGASGTHDGAALKALEALSMKTTVPPSAQSRMGAGAGTSDND